MILINLLPHREAARKRRPDASPGSLGPSARGLASTEVAAAGGAQGGTARRYLEHLADSGLVVRRSRYGGAGRPEVEYRWADGG